MPQVPTYGNPQVREQALQGGFQQNIDVSSSTRALGQGLMQVAEVADRLVVRDAQDQAFKIENQIREDWQNQRAALRDQYKADNAGQYQVAADEWWKTARDTYSKGTSPMVQALAGKSLGQLRTQAQADTLGYVAVEKTKAREVNFRTLQNGIITEAGQTITPDNAKALAATTSAQIYKNAIAYAAAEGLSSDVGKSMAREQLDRFHADTAIALASKPGGAEAAKNYLNEFGKDIPLAVRTRVDTVVTAEVDNQFATQFAAQQAGKPLSDQIKATAEIKDPARREKALVEVKNNYALVQQAQLEREKQLSDQAWQLVGQGKKVPESVLAAMDGKERVQLQEHLRQKAEHAANQGNKPIKTDPATHARLIDMMLNDPEAFKTERIAAHAMKLSQTDLEQFATKQQALRGSNAGKQDSMLTDAARVDGAITAAGIDAKKNPDVAYTVQKEIDRRVRADSTAKGGKDLTADEKQKHIDAVLMDKVFVPEWGRDTQKPLTLLKPEELKDAYVTVNGQDVKLSTIPLTDRQQIIDALRRRGEVASEQSIAEIYMRNKKPAAAVKPAISPSAKAAGPAAVAIPGLRQPSLYAPPEEWAAYRAAQAQARLAAGK